MISVTTAVEAALESNAETFCHLVEIRFSGSTVYFTEGGFDVDYDGNTYLSNGLLLDMDNPKFTEDVRVGEVSLGLTGVDQSILAILLNNSQINREVLVSRAYLDADGKVISDPILMHKWRITKFSSSMGTRSAEIALNLASQWADWDKPNGVRTTDSSQRKYYADDRIFQFSTDVKEAIEWGA